MPISLSYTFTSAIFQDTFINAGGDWGNGTIYSGDQIPFITPHLWTASIGYDHPNFNMTFIAKYTGDTRVKPGQSMVIKPNETATFNTVNTLSSFLIMDISANLKLNKEITLFSTLSNIANTKSITANLPQGYRPNMPLSLMIGVKANL
jgi:Fe(3+) dicitrate transport protein